MGIFRSEAMKHGTLVLPTERARHFINLVGNNCNMCFEDMNSQSLRRPYKKYVQRLDEMERILRFLFEEVSRKGQSDIVTNKLENFLQNESAYKLDVVEAELKKLYSQFMHFKENNTGLAEQRNQALEEKFVTQTATMSLMMGARRGGSNTNAGSSMDPDFEDSVTQGLLDAEDGPQSGGQSTMFNNVAGVVTQAEQDRFARTLFRATRGNTFTHFQQIPEPLRDPKTGKEIAKSVFVVYFQDSRASNQGSSAMAEKIKKICQAFGVNIYRWPTSQDEAQRRLATLNQNLADKDKAVEAYDRFLQNEAAVLLTPPRQGANSLIEEWRLFAAKEKAIYATLNLFEGDITLRADCWYAAAEEDAIRSLLIQQSNAQQASAMLVTDRSGQKRNPPTFIRKNEFTGPFQDLVDTYGVPRYQEANPALFTVVTFPFLFGMMYGDIGHGSMLLMFGLWACWNAESLRYSSPPVYTARYMVVLMGFFSIYAGLMYNDFFSVGLNFFGSRWTMHHEGKMEIFTPDYDVKNNGGRGPYPFGLDPAWHGANNELLFLNSLKMKLSVLMGVAQMVVGVLLRFSNSVYEGSMVDFVFECLPMMAFMMCFFAYMDWMIIYKWVTPLDTPPFDQPPSLINSLICMAMGTPDKTPLYAGQATVQSILMGITMCSVPLMLLPKPLIMWAQHRGSNPSTGHQVLHDQEQGGGGALGQNGQPTSFSSQGHGHGKEGEHEEFDLAEIFIHQVIETIEYVLGTVSHTASYLRLWALSLAHQQLSLVFFQQTLLAAFTAGGIMGAVYVYLAFAFWFTITVGVLCGMDVLECFLHTLRLHWVEFQSKFYKGDGHSFEPFRFKTILEPKQDN